MIDLENITEEYLESQAIAMGAALGVDTREGSVYMDAAKGHILRTAKFFTDLRSVDEMIALDSCYGNILEEKASERNISRKDATPAQYRVSFTGVESSNYLGKRFFVDSYFFVLIQEDNLILLEAETSGVAVNYLTSGSAVIPVENISNLTACTLGEIYTDGTDKESDDSLRSRLKEKITSDPANANKQQYVIWCEEVTGVGKARVIPLWNGNNTVKCVIISTEGTAPTTSLIEELQEYMDPAVEGVGEGIAPLGAFCTVVGATEVSINISFNVLLADGYTAAQAIAEVETAMTTYFKTLSLNNDEDTLIVRYTQVSSIITNLASIDDFSSLLVNAGNSNITILITQVPVIGEVSISGYI